MPAISVEQLVHCNQCETHTDEVDLKALVKIRLRQQRRHTAHSPNTNSSAALPPMQIRRLARKSFFVNRRLVGVSCVNPPTLRLLISLMRFRGNGPLAYNATMACPLS